ncbi:sigma D regulator [Aeromonas enteropelogenes]|uniref:sigma D regulator n=1 Tax=Aeromonas enteropelogenes TaxID=29489 RepID=UPI00191F755D|nr:sigma D regulator [Aeromonas enteropelogenes]MBL0457577.1 sigma D regulator [Aeromonas enteropelogenes]
MLTKLEQTKQALAGKHKAIDDWLDERQALLVEYMRLAGLTPARAKQRCLPKPEELQHFCDKLVDYVSAGHFEIYHHVVTAFEQASGETLELAKRIYPHIRTSTEFALEFTDKYSEADEAQLLLLDEDLNQLGPVLEERFKQEDRLVKALHVVESLSAQQA